MKCTQECNSFFPLRWHFNLREKMSPSYSFPMSANHCAKSKTIKVNLSGKTESLFNNFHEKGQKTDTQECLTAISQTSPYILSKRRVIQSALLKKLVRPLRLSFVREWRGGWVRLDTLDVNARSLTSSNWSSINKVDDDDDDDVTNDRNYSVLNSDLWICRTIFGATMVPPSSVATYNDNTEFCYTIAHLKRKPVIIEIWILPYFNFESWKSWIILRKMLPASVQMKGLLWHNLALNHVFYISEVQQRKPFPWTQV